MRTLFYLSASQLERIKPFFPRSQAFPALMTDALSATSSASSNMGFRGRMPLMNTVRT